MNKIKQFLFLSFILLSSNILNLIPYFNQQTYGQNNTSEITNNNTSISLSPFTNTSSSWDGPQENLVSESDKVLSKNMTHAHNPILHASENEIFVIWEQTMPSGGSDVFFTKSSDHGITFDDAINLSNDTTDSINPKIATSGENVYVSWGNVFPNGTGQILLRSSFDKGNTFDNVIDISNDSVSIGSDDPQLAAHGEYAYVIWENIVSTNNNEIFFSRSSNNGQNFSQPITISNTTGNSISPRIVVEDTSVFIVWEDNTFGDYDILYLKSRNNGESFNDRINLSVSGGNSLDPNIEVNENNVFVVWKDFLADNSENSEILFSKSTDGGQTFSDAKIISKTMGSSQHPTLTSFRNYVYIVWEDATEANSEIYFIRSVDEGDAFLDLINLSNNEGESTDPVISIEERTGDVNIAWTDHYAFNTEAEISFIKSETAGATFGPVDNISDTPLGDSGQPSIVTARSDVYTTWEDDITGEGWVTFIFFSIVD